MELQDKRGRYRVTEQAFGNRDTLLPCGDRAAAVFHHRRCKVIWRSRDDGLHSPRCAKRRALEVCFH